MKRFAEIGHSEQLHRHIPKLSGHIVSAVDVKLDYLLRGLVASRVQNVNTVVD